jgi:hypothetical protein
LPNKSSCDDHPFPAGKHLISSSLKPIQLYNVIPFHLSLPLLVRLTFEALRLLYLEKALNR